MAENTTNATLLYTRPSDTDTLFKDLWKGLLLIPALMLIYNTWVVAGLFAHARRTNMLKKCSRRDMNGGIIYKAAIAMQCISLARFAMTLAIYIVGLDPNAHSTCQTVIYISNVTFVAPIVAMYAFLWLRQRAFYQHPSLGGLFNRSISVLSKLSLILIVTLTVISLCFEIVLNRYGSSPVGCRFRNNQMFSRFRFFIYAVVLASGQTMMLGLFIYPLYVHSQSLKRFRSHNAEKVTKINASSVDVGLDSEPYPDLEATQDSEIAVTPVVRTKFHHDAPQNRNNNAKAVVAKGTVKSATGQSMRKSRVYGLIKRTLYLACISVASDITAMAVSGFLVLGDSPYYIMCLFLDADTVVNVTNVLLSFQSWREILLFGRQCANCVPGTCSTSRIRSKSVSETITQ